MHRDVYLALIKPTLIHQMLTKAAKDRIFIYALMNYRYRYAMALHV